MRRRRSRSNGNDRSRNWLRGCRRDERRLYERLELRRDLCCLLIGRCSRRSSLGEASVALVQGELDGLACIACRRRYADERSDLVGGVFRAGKLHPLLHARVELAGRNVLRGDSLGFGPVTTQSVGEREVLTDSRIGPRLTRGGVEDGDCLDRRGRQARAPGHNRKSRAPRVRR